MCLYPQNTTYINERGERVTVTHACGKCIDCLKDYQNSWKIRLSEEFALTCKGVFFTLTYSPENAPCAFDPETGEVIESDELSGTLPTNDPVPHSVCHDDIKSWLKRSRENLALAKGRRLKYKYFITEEYGPITLRPHAHGLIFGLEFEDVVEFFLNPWAERFGFTYQSKIDYNEDSNHSPQRVANYVSKYCSKGEFENPRVSAGIVEKPRRFISNGIGRKYAEKLRSDILGDYKEVSVALDEGDPVSWQPFRYQPLNTIRYLSGLASDTSVSLASDTKWFDLIRYYPPRIRPNKRNALTQSIPAPERVAVPIKESFLKIIVDKLNCPYWDSKTETTYVYKMPRYIKTKIIGEKTALSNQVKGYLQTRNDELYREKFRTLSALHPDWSFAQTDSYIVRSETYARKRYSDRTRRNLAQFYSQANF